MNVFEHYDYDSCDSLKWYIEHVVNVGSILIVFNGSQQIHVYHIWVY